MAMILTESGFITQSENKPESMFKVGDLIRPTLNNQFDGMSTDEIWEVIEVNGYDRMNGYVYTIKPNNDAAKAYRSENSTDGEAEGFAEIAGFENSPEEQAWTLAIESITESNELNILNKLVDYVSSVLQIYDISFGVVHIKDRAVEAELIYEHESDIAKSAFIDADLKFELVDEKTFRFYPENQDKQFNESFEYDEASEEDQGLFDFIGTKVVDTLFPGIQFEADEMEKLDDAIDKLIYVYKSVKSRSAKTANESIDNKHYKNVNTVNGKNVVAANLSSEHKKYKDTYLGYVSFELDDGSDACYPVDLDGNLVDDKNAWNFINKQGLPEVTFGGKVIKESKDIDTLLDIAGGKEAVENRILDAIKNYPDAEADEIAEILSDDETSFEDWTSIIEYLNILI